MIRTVRTWPSRRRIKRRRPLFAAVGSLGFCVTALDRFVGLVDFVEQIQSSLDDYLKPNEHLAAEPGISQQMSESAADPRFRDASGSTCSDHDRSRIDEGLVGHAGTAAFGSQE